MCQTSDAARRAKVKLPLGFRPRAFHGVLLGYKNAFVWKTSLPETEATNLAEENFGLSRRRIGARRSLSDVSSAFWRAAWRGFWEFLSFATNASFFGPRLWRSFHW